MEQGNAAWSGLVVAATVLGGCYSFRSRGEPGPSDASSEVRADLGVAAAAADSPPADLGGPDTSADLGSDGPPPDLPPRDLGGPEAPMDLGLDGTHQDGPSVDLGIDGPPPDAASMDVGGEGPPGDAGPGCDALVREASPCDGGRALCAGACVDLQTDPNHCGACGYRAVGGRSCVEGRPSPGWRPMGADPPSDVVAYGWTGRRFLWVSADGTRGYDLATERWSVVVSGPPPFQTGGRGPQFIAAPDRGMLLVVGAPTGSPGSADRLFIFTEAGGGAWIGPYPFPSGEPRRDHPDLAYDGRRLFVTHGAVSLATMAFSPPPQGLVFDLPSLTWSGRITLSASRPRLFAPTVALHGGTLVSVGGVGLDRAYPRDPTVVFSTPPSSTVTTLTPEPAVTRWVQPALLTLGARALVVDDDSNRAWLLEPSGANRITDPPYGGRRYAYIAFTGRAVLFYGGLSGMLFDSGFAAILEPSGTTVWRSLPTMSRPAAQRLPLLDQTHHNAQDLWTGQELLVFGGWSDSAGTAASGDARYQPPVGCVCPTNLDAPPWLPNPCAAVDLCTITVTGCEPL
ncbi:MAG: hypothetical protein HY909_06180 [Deltaproteobacteria bacterium]|nr:hypothetical protein [Deltaproteobacteria bacterium]